jgi:hypothetical protein
MKKMLYMAVSLAVVIAGVGLEQTYAASKKKKKDVVAPVESSTSGSAVPAQKEKNDITIPFKPYYIYTEGDSKLNHYYPSGWTGDIGDLKIDDACEDNPYQGKTCFKISYNAKGAQGWAGIFWQDPPNNWGTMKGGADLSGAKKFIMYIRGAKGGEHVGGFTIGGVLDGKKSSDTDKISLNPMVLTTQWEKVEIDVSKRNLKNIISGLSFSIGAEENPDGATFYLDEVRFE